jgi:DNA-binding PadR family transcriptional regulator
MLALVRLKDEAYGMRVRREIQSRTERSVTIGSVYATLDRLETKGYVVSSVARSGGASRGRARKYFHLTPEGAAALLDRQDAIQRMTEGLSLRNELEAI